MQTMLTFSYTTKGRKTQQAHNMETCIIIII